MPNWIRVYEASQRYIRSRASSGLFVASVYAVIGLLGVFLVADGITIELPIGVLFLCIGLVGGTYLGYRALQEWTGQPILLTVRVVRKQDAESYARTGIFHRFYITVETQKAVRLMKDGDVVPLPCERWEILPVSDRLFEQIIEGDIAVVVCTPTGVAFATLDDLSADVDLKL